MGIRSTYDIDRFDVDRFESAYDKVMAKWPVEREAVTVPTPFGETYVNGCGPADGRPLVLLPGGGGATSASWYAQTADLARARHRVYAVDLIGAPGRSVPAAGRRPRTVADLTAWLDALLDGLGVTAAVDLGGHSYGGWIALHYALRAPARVRRLFLLDPTQCFAGFETAYLLHALPMLLRPTGRRVRAFLEWETGGVPLDPDWLRLQEAGAGFPSVKPVTGPRPAPDALRGLNASVLLLLAGSSRTLPQSRLRSTGGTPITHLVAARAGGLLPHVETDILPDVSHHALPHAAPERLGRHLTGFLGS
ncbi:alpha/beta fold hydrolase [Streptomyces sp. NPDC058469]|uniref:alpha/beta fold hydrolase n=1 Tax=Streptomyces sp. NPDC058469 TaxID=3346514 RepID=UPI0036589EE9